MRGRRSIRALTLAAVAVAVSGLLAQAHDDGYEDFLRTLSEVGRTSPEFAAAKIALVNLADAPDVRGTSFTVTSPGTDLEFSAFRVDAGGALGVALGRYDLGWRLHAGTQRLFAELGDALPFDHYHDFGFALAIGVEHLGVCAENVLIGASILTGPDLNGWGIGLDLEL